MTAAPASQTPKRRGRAAFWLACLAGFASLWLNLYPVFQPVLVDDDLQILLQSWTWDRTWAGLWVPQNEHAMPLGRLFTFGLNALAGRPSALPLAAALVGPLGLLLGLPLVYRFVTRELGHPFYGVVALLVFGVTGVYQQAIFWFAASFSVYALDMLLLALLAAQNYRRTSAPLQLGLCVLWCALSPCWFAYGVLAGPLCCLYLWPAERGAATLTIGARLRFWLVRSAPLLGTVLFLVLSLPHNYQTIMHLEHYQMQKTNARDAFQLDKGMVHTGTAIVENLLLGVVGVCGVSVPTWLVVLLLLGIMVVGGWCWLRTPDWRLLLLGCGLILAPYLLAYSARAKWAETILMNTSAWSRYHLWPQLGLALFVCGTLAGGRVTLKPGGALTRRQAGVLGCLIALFLLIQSPRAMLGTYSYIGVPEQLETLRRIEIVDQCCRDHGISAEAARRSLGRLTIPGSDRIDGWELLRGSDRPTELLDEEVRRILATCP